LSIRVVTDSTCDLPQAVVTEYGVTVLPMYINIGSRGYLDGVELTRKEFYERLPEFDPPPTTGTPGSETFRRAYESLAAEGATEILSIHISVSLSAVVNVAKLAAADTQSVPITVFDSRQLSLGTGFLVETAARSAKEGRSMTEIVSLLEDQIARTHVCAALDTLEFLRRSGRMNRVVARLGSLLQVKPLLKMYDGDPTSERIRTRGQALGRLVDLLAERAPLERLALLHTHAPDSAEAFRQRIAHLLPRGEVPSVDITPVIGSHIGPGAVGFACVCAQTP